MILFWLVVSMLVIMGLKWSATTAVHEWVGLPWGDAERDVWLIMICVVVLVYVLLR